VLEDAKFTTPSGQKIAPLHQDQGEEVNTLGFIQQLARQPNISELLNVIELQYHRRERHSVTLEVPESHCHGTEGLGDSEETISMKDELPVCETILLDVPRFP